VREPFGARTLVFDADEIAGWILQALDGVLPVNKRRDSLKPIVQRALLIRTDSDDAWEPDADAAQGARQGVADPPPAQARRPVPARPRLRARREGVEAWTAADQFLLDEANSLLNGPPFTFGHVVVDEAQDHSPSHSARSAAAARPDR
jgi:hypothetical protein